MGRVLAVDPFHKNDFKFLVYFRLVFNISLKCCCILFLYLNFCKLFEVFNPRINKTIIIVLYYILLYYIILYYYYISFYCYIYYRCCSFCFNFFLLEQEDFTWQEIWQITIHSRFVVMTSQWVTFSLMYLCRINTNLLFLAFPSGKF